MSIALTLLAYIASVLVWIRFRQYFRLHKNPDGSMPSLPPKISVIVPARNEEKNIVRMLTSICASNAYEVIVVDDQSTDRTRALAETFPVKVIRAGSRPEGWIGKTWACHVGAAEATGDVLLFTDADTVHDASGLQRAYEFMRTEKVDMTSAPAFHLNQHWWERLLGPFHCLIHAGVSPYDTPTGNNAYAMGQFLLIDAETYRSIGGHASVRSALAEDAAIAHGVLRAGARYKMYNGPQVCSVQMYRSLSEFVSGWVRLIRLGMGVFNVRAVAYSLIPLLALNAFNLFTLSWLHWIPVLTTLICFALVQRRIGYFSVLGIVLFPVSVGLFLGIALYATLLEWMKQPISWRGRLYPIRQRSS